jgi:hypothetical protein
MTSIIIFMLLFCAFDRVWFVLFSLKAVSVTFM